ncbi:MAG: hypothetical protein ABSG63_08310 [Spirochaetia bacterium]|jgi:hypothetical protein
MVGLGTLVPTSRILMYNSDMVREVVDQKTAIAALCRDLGVERLFLFGSATRQNTLADSCSGRASFPMKEIAAI